MNCDSNMIALLFLNRYVHSFAPHQRAQVCYLCHNVPKTLTCFGEWLQTGNAVISVLPTISREVVTTILSRRFTLVSTETFVFQEKFVFRISFLARIGHHVHVDDRKYHINNFRYKRFVHYRFRFPKKIMLKNM